jgi:hypothetical protein
VGASICTRKARTSQQSTAIQTSGKKGIATRRRLEGMCVNTMVFTKPIRLASLAATHKETAVSTWEAKNSRPSSCGWMPKRVKNQYDAKLCPIRPVPKLSTVNRHARVAMRVREDSLRGLTQRVGWLLFRVDTRT